MVKKRYSDPVDRYTYVQGKTDWVYEVCVKKNELVILEDIRKFVEIMQNPDSKVLDFPSIHSSLFRQNVLLSIVSRYFPKTKAITKGYFDSDSRAAWGSRHQKVQKQKKLTKFFGLRPTTEQMHLQEYDGVSILGNEGYESVRPASEYSEDFGEMDKRKKAEKLAGFFGDQLTGRQMKKQNLLESEINSGDMSGVSLPPSELYKPDDEDFVLLGNLNELTPEEKIVLTKRAKKLLGVLGAEVDTKVVSKTQGKHGNIISDAKQQTLSPQFIAGLSSPSILSLDSSVSEFDIRSTQKQRLDKISYVMGERISEDVIQKYEKEPPLVVARPLTVSEKKLYQKKNTKLERVFGNTVPSDNVIHYGGVTMENEGEESATEVESTGVDKDIKGHLEDDRQNQIARLRKLRKVLGINAEGGPAVSEEALRQIEEAIKKDVDNEDDRVSLFSDLEKMKKSSFKK